MRLSPDASVRLSRRTNHLSCRFISRHAALSIALILMAMVLAATVGGNVTDAVAPNFTPRVDLGTGAAPILVTVGGLNRYGKGDLAVTKFGSNTVWLPLSSTTFTVNSTADTDDGVCNAANCTLREAINAANANSGADTINFSVSGTITLGSTLPDIGEGLTIDGTGQNIIIDGAHQHTIMFTANSPLSVNRLTFTNGLSDTCTGVNDPTHCDGGAIWAFAATVNITNCTFSNNSATRFGGAIAATGGKLTITGSTFSNNTSGHVGGGICAGTCAVTNFIALGDATISDSVFSSNSATYSGGGISIDGYLNVSNTTFSDNSARQDGGAIDAVAAGAGGLSVNKSNFSGNSADTGGGIYSSITATIANSTFSGNNASTGGGGIFEINGTLNVTNGSFINNGATSFAGAIGTVGRTTVIGTTFSGNHSQSGGAILTVINFLQPNLGPFTLHVINSTFSNNSASSSSNVTSASGGAILNSCDAISVTNSTFSGNSAFASGSQPATGGAIANYLSGIPSASVSVTNSSFSANSTFSSASPAVGGAIYNSAGAVNLTHSTLSGNFGVGVPGAGGGIYTENNGTLALKNTIIANNIGDCVSTSGTVTAANNLIMDSATACGLTNGSNGNLIGFDPLLGPLANNGGPTQTFALSSGSTAIEHGTDVTMLNGAIDNAVTSVALTDASAFPAGVGFAIRIDNEQMIIIAKASNTLTVTRAANGTVAAAHSSGAAVNPAFDQRGRPRRIGPLLDIGSYESGPTISAGGPTTFCAGGNVTLNSNSTSGNQWYLNGNPIGGATNQQYVATASGNYTVVVTVDAVSSDRSAAVTVTVNPFPANPTINASTNGTGTQDQACPEQPLTLTATSAGATSYQWYQDGGPLAGQTSSTLIVTGAGTFNATATANGCTTAQSAGYVVQNPTPHKPFLSAGGPTTFCQGGSVTLMSDSATGIQWYKDGVPIPGATSQNYVATASGSYNAQLNALGCHSEFGNPITVTVGQSAVTVSNSNDSGAGSLRQAIADACDGSTITFNMASVVTPITLGAELVINKNLTIQGPGANLLTVSGNNVTRIFNIQPGKTVVISGLKISNGRVLGISSGAGVFNQGTLTLKNCTVSGNTSVNAGGGGIDNNTNIGSVSLTIVNSTVSGNAAANGAGILNVSTGGTASLTIVNTTISGNRAAGNGGGILNAGFALSIKDSTISGNGASINGGGIFDNGDVALSNTIVSDNTAQNPASGPDIFRVSGNITGDFNIIETSTGYLIGGAGNLFVDPMLQRDGMGNLFLKNNGGPTPTILPLPGSLAINTGNPGLLPVDTFDFDGDANTAEPLPVDQRGVGFNRVIGALDRGAAEVNYSIAATAGIAQSTAINTDFPTQLQATVQESGNNQPGVAVTFTAPSSGASGTFGGSAIVNTNAGGVATAPVFTANGTAGAYNVIASLSGGSPSTSFALTNLKGNQTISFGPIANKTFGDPDFLVVATASSGLPVTLMASGQCTVSSPAPGSVHLTGAGSCTITASQPGNANYNAAASVPKTFTIAKAATATSVSSSVNPSQLNQSVTFTATVSSVAAKTGTVQFKDNGGNLGAPVALNGSGIAQFTTSALAFGTHTITAEYSGDTNFLPSMGTLAGGQLVRATTTTAVSSNFNPSDLNQTVTFTATVSSVAAKTGTVQFKDNGNNFGAPITLNASGVAQLTTSSLTAGTHTITAEYSGDANFLPSTGTLAGGQVVKQQPSLSINDVSITEGDAGTKVLAFTVTLSAGSNLPVSVNYATANGTATAASDYVATSGSFTFNPLDNDVTRTVNVTINGDVSFEPDETFTVTLTNPVNATISKAVGTGTIQNDDAQGGIISFSQANTNVNESTGLVTLTVVRSNNLSQAVNVDYATDDTGASTNCAALNTGLASQRCDYTSVFGTLKFATNETQKTIDVPVNLDAYTEGPETFTVKLSNPTGGAVLAAPSTGTVTINDSASPTPNAIDDTTNFVRQQYRDFLNREADPTGLAFWVDNIDKCNDPARRPAGQTLAQCIEVQRITTSAAFFLSIEFKQTGGLVREFYVAALDRPATNNMPNFVEFMRDTQGIQKGVIVGQGNWQQILDANRTAFMNEFVTRAEFVALYPTTDTPAQYVDKLYLHAAVMPGSPQERLDAIAEFGGAPTAADPGARGRALLRITQNAAFQAREMNRTFVQIEYFGYLRRNPNDAPDNNFNGFNFWVNKLNQFNGDYLQAEMVKAFLASSEYRGRFGP